MEEQTLEEIAKRRGIFWQSSSIYGGVSGLYDYAHLGTLIKRKWENLWRDFFLSLDDNYFEIEASQIMPRKVFEASGHLESFVDPIVTCEKCDNKERADQILEEELQESFEGLDPENLESLIDEHNITCSKCGGKLTNAGQFNMMFQLDDDLFLRPETAQGAYLNFKQEYIAQRKKMPMGLAIVGKAFRNEISPRNLLIRLREFTQAELQIFLDPKNMDKLENFDQIKDQKVKIKFSDEQQGKERSLEELNGKFPKFYLFHMLKMQEFYLDKLNIPKEKFRFRELSKEERAFYNKYHLDLELELTDLGFTEMAGLHYRTDHDLKGHNKVSPEKLKVTVDGEKLIPHVLEVSFGVDRNIYGILDIGIDNDEDRSLIQLPKLVAPFDCAVFPLVSKDNLPEKAKQVKESLEEAGLGVFYDEGGSIGKRYRRVDEIGVPAAITIDYDSKEDECVTIRDRDSMDQIRVKIENLPGIIKQFISGKSLNELGN